MISKSDRQISNLERCVFLTKPFQEQFTKPRECVLVLVISKEAILLAESSLPRIRRQKIIRIIVLLMSSDHFKTLYDTIETS